MKKPNYFSLLILILTFSSQFVQAQWNVPEMMYYRFENNPTLTTVINYASSPVGTNPATLLGHTLGPGGQFDTCMIGTGGNGGTTFLNTGWATNMPTNWTISLWLNNLVDLNPTYLWGDNTAGSFRFFYGGAALANNCLFRGTFTDILITGVMPGPTVVTLVYDGTNVTVYKNGVQFGVFPRSITAVGSGPFKIGGYSTTNFSMSGRMDEFRMYNRALSAAEVQATWNVELPVLPACNYNWTPQVSGVTTGLITVKAVSNFIGWAAGASAVVRRTTDGGQNWTNANPNPGVINGDIYAIDAFDANTAWCTTSPTATFIYRTTNGGTNWTQVFTQAGGFIDDIKFNDANTGFAYGDPVGGRWSLWKSTNGGATWDSTGLYLAQVGNEAGWNNAMIVIDNTIWFGTNNTRVYKSTNYGSIWTFGPTTGVVNSSSVHFNSSTLGLVGNYANGTMARTTDGGTLWTLLTGIPGTGSLSGIEGTGTNFWFTRGTGIYRSSNSGDNWTLNYTASAALTDIDFAIVNNCPQGWAVGSNGVIVKMITDSLVGISGNNNQVPNSYSLAQNYPNPFNPSTKISFAIPKAGNVELKVYDILGREAAVIVNEFKQAGEYTIEFNANKLASGVYFYTLKSGEFTDTKKMLLIK